MTTTDATGLRHVVFLGNPNTGKTTLFNRLSGLKAKTSNFPGTTQESRTAHLHDAEGPLAIIDLPGVYSLELDMSEASICREVLAGRLAPTGERAGDPDAVLVVVDSTNLARNLILVGEVLRRRLPTIVALNMMDLADREGLAIDTDQLAERLGCPVLPIAARSGRGTDRILPAARRATIPNHTPPGTREGLEAWADEVYAAVVRRVGAGHADDHAGAPHAAHDDHDDRTMPDLTDRIDRVTMHPVFGPVLLLAVMAGLFWSIFSLAAYPMDGIDLIFGTLTERLGNALPEGILSDLFVNGIVAGIGATVIFLPQICLLFFLLSLLEDTGYLARGAMLVDRLLRPFGLPGHAFVPFLSSHACALPGIMSARAVPDARDRLATILVAPFMTCSARLPVYILLITLLFRDSPVRAALAFVGCYALGIVAALLSALLARRTILRGQSRPMILELPTYKIPSLRTALITTADRAWTFLKKAGTTILGICIVLWWLGSYPHLTQPSQTATQLREQAAEVRSAADVAMVVEGSTINPSAMPEAERASLAETLDQRAERADAVAAQTQTFMGRLGRLVQPIFAPLGYDWQLSVGVLSSFAAREVFVSTMAVVTTGSDDAEDESIISSVQNATRDDGTPVFTRPVAWSLLVYYVLAMQCLPTLAVTARESGRARWALLQLAWMCGLAYAAAFVTYQIASRLG